ncbi:MULTISPECIES: AAA family ATPase [unclassified Rhizobium]|uniref:AAA family ATPase n=1 Tax=unclassified Rhizobium TaxID=2613769 RepID=UPI0007E97A96|nr:MULTISPECIES: AAA family ATPase [unclassified Rhizobium]ANM09238.1 AAA ATPase domain-containing protein [Rhizobium sp. N324]OYD02806.1 AAA ATPase domain-containing protein [Rhizobium sp. N4311]
MALPSQLVALVKQAQREAVARRHRLVGPEHIALADLRLSPPLLTSQSSQRQKDDYLAWLNSQLDLRPAQPAATATELDPVVLRASDEAGGSVQAFLKALVEGPDAPLRQARERFSLSVPSEKIVAESAGAAKPEFLTELTAPDTLKRLSMAYERDSELGELAVILCQMRANNVMLIGDPGVGKTALVETLALSIASDKLSALSKRRVFELDLGHMLAICRFPGEFEDNMRAVLAFCGNTNDILFVDEVHLLMGASGSNSRIDAANLLKPPLARGALRMIGATTYVEFRRHVEPDSAFVRRFQLLHLDQPSAKATNSILERVAPRFEEAHGVSILPAARERIVELTDRFVGGRSFPDKAIKLLDRVGSAAKLARKKRVPPDFVDLTFAQMARLPLDYLRHDSSSHPVGPRLRGMLNNTLIGQEAAIDQVISSLERQFFWNVGRADGARALLLVGGPSGSGKSALLAGAARALVPDSDHVLSFDMRNFSEPGSISQLVGPPVGIVGHDEGGKFTELLDRYPSAFVHIENLHLATSDVRSRLLDLLRRGWIEDTRGKRVLAANCIIAIEVADKGDLFYEALAARFGGIITLRELRVEDAPAAAKRAAARFSADISRRLGREVELMLSARAMARMTDIFKEYPSGERIDFIVAQLKNASIAVLGLAGEISIDWVDGVFRVEGS